MGEYTAFILMALLFAASFVLGDACILAAYTERLRPLLLGGVLTLGSAASLSGTLIAAH